MLLDGYTNNDSDLTELSSFITSLKNVEKVEVLPYHTMGEVKYKKLGYEYPLVGVTPPTKESVLNAKKILGVIK